MRVVPYVNIETFDGYDWEWERDVAIIHASKRYVLGDDFLKYSRKTGIHDARRRISPADLAAINTYFAEPQS